MTSSSESAILTFSGMGPAESWESGQWKGSDDMPVTHERSDGEAKSVRDMRVHMVCLRIQLQKEQNGNDGGDDIHSQIERATVTEYHKAICVK